MTNEIRCHNCIPTEPLAALLLRLALGSVLFVYGLNKFLAPGGVLKTVEGLASGFKETYLPMFLVWPFAYIIPFAELVLGALLVVGLVTRASLLASGLLLIGLTTGMAILGKPDVVANNLIYVGLIVAALWFASRDNRYSLDRLFRIP